MERIFKNSMVVYSATFADVLKNFYGNKDKEIVAYRKGWNGTQSGKQLFITVSGDYEVEFQNLNEDFTILREVLFKRGLKTLTVKSLNFVLWNHDHLVVGWTPSQTDMGATDWVVEWLQGEGFGDKKEERKAEPDEKEKCRCMLCTGDLFKAVNTLRIMIRK